MPELAELKTTADYINYHSKNTEGPCVQYCNIVKNPVHKCMDVDSPNGLFSISAESRGKELLMYIHKAGKTTPIRFTMGMSGYFKVTNTGNEPKHAHLKFHRKDGTTFVNEVCPILCTVCRMIVQRNSWGTT